MDICSICVLNLLHDDKKGNYAMKFTYNIPLQLKTNVHASWKTKWITDKKDADLVRLYTKNLKVKTPAKVVLTRIGKKNVDYDNLVYAFKSIRDAIADVINPGKASGVADTQGLGLKFVYQQKVGQSYSVEIVVEELIE
jgi:hypothetical protein